MEDAEVYAFLKKHLVYYGSLHSPSVPPETVDGILSLLLRHRDDPDKARQAVYESPHSPLREDGIIRRSYNNLKYRWQTRPICVERLIDPYITGGVVADIGAGFSSLGQLLLEKHPRLRRVINVDIQEYPRPPDSRIEFLLSRRPDEIPLLSGSVDLLLFIEILHHAAPYVEDLLREAARVGRPGARILVLEDTWSDVLAPVVPSDLLDTFMRFSSEKRFAILRWTCWYQNHLVKGISSMPLPFSFKTMDEWEKTARRFGLNLVAKEFVGFPNLPFSHSTVLGVLAFETPRLLASGFTARTTAAPASGSGGLTKPHHGLPSAA